MRQTLLIFCFAFVAFSNSLKAQCSTTPTISVNAGAFNNTCLLIQYTYTTEPGMTNYAWTISSGGSTTSILTGSGASNSINVGWIVAGSQSVSVNYTNTSGCTQTSPTVQNINVVATASITGNTSISPNSTGNVYTTASGKAGYTWFIYDSNPPNGSQSNAGTITSGLGTNNITITWIASGLHHIAVFYSDPTSTACQAGVGVLDVNVTGVITPTIAGNNSVAIGTTTQYSTEGGMASYNWTVTGGTITSGIGTNKVMVNWNSIGNRSVSITYVNGGILSTSTQLNVVVNNITPTIIGTTNVCLGTTTQYSTEAGMTSYNWVISGGTISSGNGTNSVLVNWNSQGNQSISVNYVSGGYLTATTQFNVLVWPTTPATISGNFTICPSPNSVFVTEPNMTSYSWILDNIVIEFNANSLSYPTSQLLPGTHTLSVSYVNPGGCRVTSPTQTFTVLSSPPAAALSGPQIICTVPSNGNIYITDAGKSSCTWAIYKVIIDSNGNAGLSLVTSSEAQIMLGSGTNQITISWNQIGRYVIMINYPDISGCQSQGALGVMVSNGPSTLSSPLAQSMCSGNIFNYVPQSTTPSAQFSWIRVAVGGITQATSTGGGSISETLTNTTNSPINVVYAFSINGCNTQNVIVTVNPMPTLSSSLASTVCSGSTFTYAPTSSLVGSTFSWSRAAVTGISQAASSGVAS